MNSLPRTQLTRGAHHRNKPLLGEAGFLIPSYHEPSPGSGALLLSRALLVNLPHSKQSVKPHRTPPHQNSEPSTQPLVIFKHISPHLSSPLTPDKGSLEDISLLQTIHLLCNKEGRIGGELK